MATADHACVARWPNARMVFARAGVALVESCPEPETGPGDAVVESRVSLIGAGTELAYLRSRIPWFRLGLAQLLIYPGYSTAGCIRSCSDEVSLCAGERGFALAPHQRRYGHPASRLLPVPAAVSDESATFAALDGVALHAVERAAIGSDQQIVIWGRGLVGQLTPQLGRQTAVGPVIAVDRYPDRLGQSLRAGADTAVDAAQEDVLAAIGRATAGYGADRVRDRHDRQPGRPAARHSGRRGRRASGPGRWDPRTGAARPVPRIPGERPRADRGLQRRGAGRSHVPRARWCSWPPGRQRRPAPARSRCAVPHPPRGGGL